jgi:hypothetical protein
MPIEPGMFMKTKGNIQNARPTFGHLGRSNTHLTTKTAVVTSKMRKISLDRIVSALAILSE